MWLAERARMAQEASSPAGLPDRCPQQAWGTSGSPARPGAVLTGAWLLTTAAQALLLMRLLLRLGLEHAAWQLQRLESRPWAT